MIDKLRSLALKIQWLKPVTLVIGLAAITLIAYLLIAKAGSSQYDHLHIPSVIALLWAGVTYWLLYTFPGVPEKPGRELGFFKRLGINFKRGCFFVLAVLAIAITAGSLMITIRGLSVWLQSYA